MGLRDRISAGMCYFAHTNERLEQERRERAMALALEGSWAREGYARYEAAHFEQRARRSEERARHERHQRIEERRRSEEQARRFQGQAYHDRNGRVADILQSERYGFRHGYMHGYSDAAHERNPPSDRHIRFEDPSSTRRHEEQIRAQQNIAGPRHHHQDPPR